MTDTNNDQYSAGEQGLGYIYQPRFALLRLLQLPESTSILIEKDDDLDFVDKGGVKTLASLKHKAIGDRLTDLSIDFWKSVRIWLRHATPAMDVAKPTSASSCSRRALSRRRLFCGIFSMIHPLTKSKQRRCRNLQRMHSRRPNRRSSAQSPKSSINSAKMRRKIFSRASPYSTVALESPMYLRS